jgi:acetyl esterase/lipase
MLRRLLALVIALVAFPAFAQELPEHTRSRDVIYCRKLGVCLTMDVFTPKEHANGAGVVAVISGGWISRHSDLEAAKIFAGELLRRGYTVFAVLHGSQPKFNILEAVEDMHKAIRFIRHNAKNYGIDPNRIGITGASAGCHLALMMAVEGAEGNPKAKDPVDRESSKVEAVAGFFPPTDFFNYGREGSSAEPLIKVGPFAPAFDFRERDSTNNWKPVSEEKRKEILKRLSPIYHVSEQTPPTLLIHGDLDLLVPLQQSKIMIAKLKENKVPCELIVHKGGSHGWSGIDKDVVKLADWFDKYLPKK